MNPRLELSAEEMRRLGYRVIDLLVEHYATLGSQRVGAKADPGDLFARIPATPPEEGAGWEPALDFLRTEILPNTLHVNHPRFFAFVPGPGNFVGAMADALASGFNVFAGTWMGGSGAAAIETVVVDWLRRACGLPESARGLFVSGGTMANLTALAAARQALLKGDLQAAAAYCSDQVHSSVEKSLRVIGLPDAQIRRLPCDAAGRLPAAALAAAVERDCRAGLRPFCVIATAGTTNTGAVDPLPAIAHVARQHNLWFHVDGAYGAAAVLCERGRAGLAGLELADSLSLDPHKWLFQPFEAGCVLVRDGALLKRAFALHPEYLKDVHRGVEEIHYTDYGIELSRGFRALKLWFSLQVFGLAAFRAAVERGFELADYAERVLLAHTEWEVVSPAQMAIVCFRRIGADEEFHARLVEAMLADGHALMTSTVLHGRTVLRICTINPRTTEEDIDSSLRRLDELAGAFL